MLKKIHGNNNLHPVDVAVQIVVRMDFRRITFAEVVRKSCSEQAKMVRTSCLVKGIRITFALFCTSYSIRIYLVSALRNHITMVFINFNKYD